MNEDQCRRVLPELLRFATDPQLDAMTRTWVFDALRDISGQKFGDDGERWHSWYLSICGAKAVQRDYQQQLANAAWLS